MTTNDAAERLKDNLPGGWEWDEWKQLVDEALAAGRRATVGRIRASVESEPFFPEADGPQHGNAAAFRDFKRRILAILDAMAER
jgi:hypothetical protein